MQKIKFIRRISGIALYKYLCTNFQVMYKALTALFITLSVISCNIRDSKDTGIKQGTSPIHEPFKDSTSVQLIDSVYNFGKVTDGEKVEYSYRFKNTGKNPLIISDAVASCGCTVPEKPDAPIQPGEIGYLKVVFNSSGKVGEVHKQITVTSNAYPFFPVLQLSGTVEAKK